MRMPVSVTLSIGPPKPLLSASLRAGNSLKTITLSEEQVNKRSSRIQDQLSLFAAFHDAGVEYAVVGGVAVNAHGFLRQTRDLDVFIRPSVENAEAAFHALYKLGAPLEGFEPTDLLSDSDQYLFDTGNTRIDVISSIGEMSFEQVWRNRVDTEIDGIPVHFISKDDLLENKRQVGRFIDLADVEQLSLIREPATKIELSALDSFAEEGAAIEHKLSGLEVHKDEPTAVHLTEEQTKLLLASEYPNDARKQTIALAAIYSGKNQINIMEESIQLDYSEDEKTFFAILRQDEKPTLDAKLTQLQNERMRDKANSERAQDTHQHER